MFPVTRERSSFDESNRTIDITLPFVVYDGRTSGQIVRLAQSAMAEHGPRVRAAGHRLRVILHRSDFGQRVNLRTVGLRDVRNPVFKAVMPWADEIIVRESGAERILRSRL